MDFKINFPKIVCILKILTERRSWAGWPGSWWQKGPRQQSPKPFASPRRWCFDLTGFSPPPGFGSRSAHRRSPSCICVGDSARLVKLGERSDKRQETSSQVALTCKRAPAGPRCVCSSRGCSSPGGRRCKGPGWCSGWRCSRWWRRNAQDSEGWWFDLCPCSCPCLCLFFFSSHLW